MEADYSRITDYLGMMRSVACRVGRRQDADDVVQETALLAIRKWGSFHERALGSWLRSATRITAASLRKKNRPWLRFASLSSEDSTAEQMLVRKQSRGILIRCLRCLPPDEQSTLAEWARGEHVNASKSFKARAKLRSLALSEMTPQGRRRNRYEIGSGNRTLNER